MLGVRRAAAVAADDELAARAVYIADGFRRREDLGAAGGERRIALQQSVQCGFRRIFHYLLLYQSAVRFGS